MKQDTKLDFLYRLGDETRYLSEPEDIMETVAALLGRFLSASRCAYADVEADGNRFTIYRDYTDGCPSSAGSYALNDFGEEAVRLLQSGETLIISDVDSQLTAEGGGDTFRSIGIQAIICCSLVKNGNLVAMMAVHQIESRQWTDDEVALIREVVERCWSTIERARAQKIALRTEKRLEDFFELAPDALVLIDSEGLIQLVNKRFSKMFEIAIGDAIGKLAVDLLPAVVIESIAGTETQQTINSGNVDQLISQAEIENSSGKKFHVEISRNPIRTGDSDFQGLSIRDVSERKRLEAELQQAQKVETLGMLAGGIAHDFNNLLTVIIGTAQLPLRKNQSDFQYRKELETIRDAGSKAAELTQQLLAFSRQQVLQPTVIDLNDALLDTRDIIARLIGENIAVRFELKEEMGGVNLDRSQIGQVLMNLAANARDAMQDGGTLTIATDAVRTLPDDLIGDEHSNCDYIQLTVSDTGSGMSEEQLAQIFDPFYTTKRSGKGTGLGLSTVYGIVIQSNGHIAVRSKIGEGTRFEMYFPRVSAPIGSQPGTTKKPATERVTEKILVVEDESVLREMLRTHLCEFGYRVETAANGDEALELFNSKLDYFDLVITDVIMPGMSGPELIDSMREARPDIKVIFSSGYTADSIGHHGVLDEDQNFLGKPYQIEFLEDFVRGVLDSNT